MQGIAVVEDAVGDGVQRGEDRRMAAHRNGDGGDGVLKQGSLSMLQVPDHPPFTLLKVTSGLQLARCISGWFGASFSHTMQLTIRPGEESVKRPPTS